VDGAVVGVAVVGGAVALVVAESASPPSLSEQATSAAATVLARNPRRVSFGIAFPTMANLQNFDATESAGW
jgi:hypothetical protein